MKRAILALLAFVFVTLTSVTAAADVLIVAAGGGGDFVEIQAAVDAANQGDTILVKSGTYLSFLIVGKQLEVLADTNASVHVDGAVRVRSLESGQTVVLSGLKVHGRLSGGVESDGLFVRNTHSSIRVQDCELHAYEQPGFLNNPHSHGAELESVDDIAFVRCDLRGSAFYYSSYDGGDGIHATDSSVALYDSASYGALGSTLSFGDGQRGGDGFDGLDSFVFASGSLLSGARGGNGDCSTGYGNGGDGGSGVLVRGALADAQLLDNALSFGAGGNLCCGLGCGENGQPGVATSALQGASVTQLAGAARTLSLPLPVREAQPIPLTIQGLPGDRAYLYITRASAFQFDAPFKGVQLTQQGYPPRVMILGPVTANGSLTTGLWASPDLGLGVASYARHVQLLMRDASGQYTLGSPAELVVLDQAF